MTTSDSTTAELGDRLAILELIGKLSLTIDAKDWDTLGSLVTDVIVHDRTSLTGGEPLTLAVDDFVAGWRQTLDGMDAVHHMITNHVISLEGDEAICTANMQGTHKLVNPSGDAFWTVGGRHIYRLKRTADGWRISALTFKVQWATGNMNILALAAGGG
jgi:hypothetical protein